MPVLGLEGGVMLDTDIVAEVGRGNDDRHRYLGGGIDLVNIGIWMVIRINPDPPFWGTPRPHVPTGGWPHPRLPASSTRTPLAFSVFLTSSKLVILIGFGDCLASILSVYDMI